MKKYISKRISIILFSFVVFGLLLFAFFGHYYKPVDFELFKNGNVQLVYRETSIISPPTVIEISDEDENLVLKWMLTLKDKGTGLHQNNIMPNIYISNGDSKISFNVTENFIKMYPKFEYLTDINAPYVQSRAMISSDPELTRQVYALHDKYR